MLLEEYNEKAEREQLRKESREEGREEEVQRYLKTLASLVDQGTLSLEQAEKAAGERGKEFLRRYQKR